MTEEKNKRPFYKPGFYPDLSNAEYHGSFGYGSTTLKVLNEKTKAHLDYQRAHPKPMSDAMIKGSVMHVMVTEPDKVDQEVVILPENINRRTKAGREEFSFFTERNKNKLIVTREQYNTALWMSESIKKHPVMGTWFDSSIPGFAEQSVYYWYKSEDWDEKNDYKTMLKVRPDWTLEGHSVLFDLKSAKDASFSGFMKQAKSLGYHMSAAMYLDGVNRSQDFLDHIGVMAFTKFVWVVVENEPPYCSTYYEIGPEDLAEGRALYHKLVRKLDRYNRSDWKGYGEQDQDGFITPEGRVSDMPRWGNNIV